MIGLNERLLHNYVEWIANRRMKAIGIKPMFDIPAKNNPLPWTEFWLNSKGQQNAPQETEIESYVIGVMDMGIRLLVTLAQYISSLPLAGWRTYPPGYLVLAVLSAGCLIFIGCHRRLYPLGILMLALSGFFWWHLPVPQGVLFAKGQTRILILAGQN